MSHVVDVQRSSKCVTTACSCDLTYYLTNLQLGFCAMVNLRGAIQQQDRRHFCDNETTRLRSGAVTVMRLDWRRPPLCRAWLKQQTAASANPFTAWPVSGDARVSNHFTVLGQHLSHGTFLAQNCRFVSLKQVACVPVNGRNQKHMRQTRHVLNSHITTVAFRHDSSSSLNPWMSKYAHFRQPPYNQHGKDVYDAAYQ